MPPSAMTTANAPDQYADGKIADAWELYIGSRQERCGNYRQWVTNLLRSHGCQNVLDAACGTGVDSVMLLEDGFQVCSVDGSDKMLKYALKERWERRKEGNGIFDRWNIEEANWLTLEEDIEKKGMIPNRGFDAVICMGNSFAHLPDSHGDGSNHLTAISNFEKVLRPGGILVIDHRNYDAILDTGRAPAKNIYYKGDNIVNISTITEFKNAKPSKVVLDYTLDVSELALKKGKAPVGYNKNESSPLLCKFQLTYHPHRLVEFRKLLSSVFGSGASHEVLGDFESLEATTCPAYYVHIVQKQNSNGFIM